MKKLLKKINEKTGWVIPFYFQLIHSIGLFAGAFLLTSWLAYLFPILKNYGKIILLVIWIAFIILTISIAVKRWRKGFLISTAILLIGYFIYLII